MVYQNWGQALGAICNGAGSIIAAEFKVEAAKDTGAASVSGTMSQVFGQLAQSIGSSRDKTESLISELIQTLTKMYEIEANIAQMLFK